MKLIVDQCGLKLTQKGREIRQAVARLFARHAEGLITQEILDGSSIDHISATLKRVERYWTDQIRYILLMLNAGLRIATPEIYPFT